MRHFVFRHWRRFLAKPAIVIVAVLVVALFALDYVYANNVLPAATIRAIPEPIRRAAEVTILAIRDLPYIQYRFQSPNLPHYQVNIDSDEWATLLSKVPKEDVGILPQEAKKSYKAELVFDSKTYPAKIDIRGDTSPHWLYRKKSWQVQLKGGATLPDGTNELNFIVPVRRYWAYEEFNNQRARKLGLRVPRSGFATLSINERDYGVYFFIEGWEEFFKREGIAPADLFAERSIGEPVWEGTSYWKKIISDPKTPSDDFSALDRLLQFVRETDDETFKNGIFSIIDEDSFYQWYAHMLLSGSIHQDWAHNLRIFVDHDTGKLAFIPWDVGAWPLDAFTPDNNFNPLISRIITIPEFREKRDRIVYDYVRNDQNLKDDLASYDEIVRDARTAFYQDRAKEIPNAKVDAEFVRYRSLIESNFSGLRQYLERSNLRVERGVASIDLVTSNPAPFILNEIHLGTSGAIVDSNENGVLDSRDRPFEAGMRLSTVPVPTNADPGKYAAMTFPEKRYRFFFQDATPESKLSISAINAVTGEDVDITIL